MDPASLQGRHRLELEHLAGLGDARRGPRRELPELALASAPIVLDIDQDAAYALHDIIRRPGYRALLAVPLLREDSLVGGLVIFRKSPGAFAPETVELVQTLANQSVLAIENAELFEALEQKSRELAVVLESMASGEREVPDYIQVDQNQCKATFVRTPALADVPYTTQMEPHLVVEYYSR